MLTEDTPMACHLNVFSVVTQLYFELQLLMPVPLPSQFEQFDRELCFNSDCASATILLVLCHMDLLEVKEGLPFLLVYQRAPCNHSTLCVSSKIEPRAVITTGIFIYILLEKAKKMQNLGCLLTSETPKHLSFEVFRL